MAPKPKLLKGAKACKWWVECDVCGKLDGKFTNEVSADKQAVAHRNENDGHHPKVATNC